MPWNGVLAWLDPVCTPLPDVPRHVEEAEVVRRERLDGARAEIPVLGGVQRWEDALPDVHPVFAVRRQLVAPGVALPIEPATGGVLPLHCRGKVRACPAAVRRRVVPRDMDDRMIDPIVHT